jgi:hypothetical protein
MGLLTSESVLLALVSVKDILNTLEVPTMKSGSSTSTRRQQQGIEKE